jgi:hypothetical protein
MTETSGAVPEASSSFSFSLSSGLPSYFARVHWRRGIASASEEGCGGAGSSATLISSSAMIGVAWKPVAAAAWTRFSAAQPRLA